MLIELSVVDHSHDTRMKTYNVQINFSKHANSNLDHRINIQRAQRERERICKSEIIRFKGGQLIIKLLNPHMPLDGDPVAQIRICTVCLEKLVCT